MQTISLKINRYSLDAEFINLELPGKQTQSWDLTRNYTSCKKHHYDGDSRKEAAVACVSYQFDFETGEPIKITACTKDQEELLEELLRVLKTQRNAKEWLDKRHSRILEITAMFQRYSSEVANLRRFSWNDNTLGFWHFVSSGRIERIPYFRFLQDIAIYCGIEPIEKEGVFLRVGYTQDFKSECRIESYNRRIVIYDRQNRTAQDFELPQYIADYFNAFDALGELPPALAKIRRECTNPVLFVRYLGLISGLAIDDRENPVLPPIPNLL